MESQRFAHAFMEEVAARHSEFVNVSCASTTDMLKVRKAHSATIKRDVAIVTGVGKHNRSAE
jgi:hypothetical protein